MAEGTVVLVTGVADYWGSRVAARLVMEPGYHVIGLDVKPPQEIIKDLDFIQADIRNPLLPELFKSEHVETVCHLAFAECERPSEAAFDLNVMGTIKVLGACAEARVRRAVIKSSMEVYGARPDNSAFLTESHPLQANTRAGYVRDLVEIEAFCNGFQRQIPEMVITLLRFPGIVGPTADTRMTRFLREMWTPILLGFDPMMQVIHEEDVVAALVHAVTNDVPGVYNVAAEGVLPMSQLMSLAGKMAIPVFHLFAYWGTGLLNSSRLPAGRYWPIELDYIRYPWVGDLSKMRDKLGFTPRYTAAEALREFAGQQRLNRYLPDTAAMAYDTERLRDTIERRRRAREREDANLTPEDQEVSEHA
jgi:UDP-glucose 4-epimerase